MLTLRKAYLCRASIFIGHSVFTLAAQELQTTDLSVIEAAYKYGYESPESFSKAFSRFHGSTPKQAKQKFIAVERAFPSDKTGGDHDHSIRETEPAEYAVFKCFGSDGDCLDETWSKFFKEFSPQTGYVQTDDPDYEIYFDKGESGLFCELWVPVKKN